MQLINVLATAAANTVKQRTAVSLSRSGVGHIDEDTLHGYQGLKKLWNFEARACIGLQKNLDFINKNVRLD